MILNLPDRSVEVSRPRGRWWRGGALLAQSAPWGVIVRTQDYPPTVIIILGCIAAMKMETNQQPDTSCQNARYVRCVSHLYDWRLLLELGPADSALQITHPARNRRCAEFTPLIRVAGVSDIRDIAVRHIRIKGANGDLLGPSQSLPGGYAEYSTVLTRSTSP